MKPLTLRVSLPWALTLALLAGACTSTRSGLSPHPALVPAGEAHGTVLLIRDSAGERASAPVQVLLDDQPVAALVAGCWTRLHLRPGVHVFEPAAARDPELRPTFQTAQPGYVRETSGVGSTKAVRLDLAPGETQFVLVRYDRTETSRERTGQGTVVDTLVLFAADPMAESTARERTREYREVSVEHP